jgi:oligopeptide transport system substrate-binding protein
MSKLRFLKAVLVIALLSALVISTGAQEGNFIQISGGNSDVPSMDPSLGTDTHSIQHITELFPGLTVIDEVTSDTKVGTATWEISEDGLVYTFSIIPEIPWVRVNPDSGEVEQVMDMDGNPAYVTADDYIYGMTRSMDPRNGGYYGSILAGWVVGGNDLYGSIDGAADDASAEDLAAMVDAASMGLGLVAVDDYTLEVTINQPAGFAAQILGMWMSTAQPSWVVEEYGDSWTEAENIVSYGPFALAEWSHGERTVMITNPFWPGSEGIPVPSVDGVVDTFLEAEAALANYEADLIDSVGVPSSELARVQADPVLGAEFSISPGTCTFYIAFNTTKAPTDDIRVRQALSQSIDRQLIIDVLRNGIDEVAYFFARPELAGAASFETHPEAALVEDMAAAQAKMEEYVAENGELPIMSYGTTTSETSARRGEILQEMWSDALGAEIEIQQQEWAVFLETTDVEETAPNIWYLGWCLDYPDANNFLFDVFHSTTIDNGTGFLNEEYDALLDEAAVMTDNAARQDLYARAEEILTNEVLAIAPLSFSSGARLVKPSVDRPLGATVTQYELWTLGE